MRIDARLLGLCLLACGAGCGDDDGSAAGSSTNSDDDDTGMDVAGDGDTGVDAAGDGGAATGGGSGADAEPPASGAAPAGSSADELAAFLDAEGYRGDGWAAETDAPRARSSDVSPHGRVRVWRNDALLASQAQGNGANLDAPAHDTGSMAVKEFYDDADQLLGRATMLKLEGDMREWAYYCSGPDDRCMDTPPVYGVGFGVSCSFCHGGLIFTQTR